jgi:hypothetical protein
MWRGENEIKPRIKLHFYRENKLTIIRLNLDHRVAAYLIALGIPRSPPRRLPEKPAESRPLAPHYWAGQDEKKKSSSLREMDTG